MKKIVIFGGGTGLSQILKGLKLFPMDITAVVSVSDNGRSTGKLREELHIPAVGDITKVMLAMSNANEDIIDLMNYRFIKSKSLGNHSVKNLLLTALIDMKGSISSSLPILEEILGIKCGKILPLTETNVDLIALTESGKKIYGEEQISKYPDAIKRIEYNQPILVNPKVIEAVQQADLIIFSAGSLYTSIIPHLIDKNLVEIIKHSKAPKMYICNLFTQPNETEGYTVSDHINKINEYFGEPTIDVVIANNGQMDSKLVEKYRVSEQKDPVIIDEENLQKMGVSVLSDTLYLIENECYRHDALKVAYLVFRYLMEGN